MDLQKIALEYRVSIDEVRSRYLMMRVAMWKADFKRFCRDAIRIRTKEGDLAPLVLNEAQDILLAAAEEQLKIERWVRIAGLKGRRQGFSTMVAARGYWRATLWQRQNIYILSHEMAASGKLFDMVALMQEKHPFPPQVGADNAKELEFPKQGSTYTVATAGQKAGGRGGAVSFFHGSEAAWWTNAADHFASSVQGVDEVRGVWGVLWREPPNPLPFERGKGEIVGWVKAPSEIWLETTSAGPMGEFHRRYLEAMKRIGRYQAAFVPWTVQREYTEEGDFVANTEAEEEGEISEAEYQDLHGLTNGQMMWRRSKTHELGSPAKFRQEYPIDVTEAFAAADIEGVFIKPSYVLKARKRSNEIPDAPLIIGVDPAGGGGDRFAVAFRRGDCIFKISHRMKLDQPAAVAWLSKIIDDWKPNRMNIDRGNIGQPLIGALRAMNPKYAEIVAGVDFGGTSKAKLAHPKRTGPVNRRAEMYGKLRDWLKEGGSIPDDDDLASDMSAALEKFRPNNDWLLESKSEMKSRGARSNDLSDACALTFAKEEYFNEWSKSKEVLSFKGAAQVELQRIDLTGIGDNDGYFEYNGTPTGWMGG